MIKFCFSVFLKKITEEDNDILPLNLINAIGYMMVFFINCIFIFLQKNNNETMD